MCNFYTGILKKTGEVLSSLDTNSHDDLVRRFKLKEKDDTNRWLRFEINPKDDDEKNIAKANWILKIDEKTEPAWYLRNKTMYDKKMWNAWKQAVAKRPQPVNRFPIEYESKLLKAFSAIFQQHNGISEDKAVKMENFAIVDPAHVVMCVAKTEEAKRLLSRFFLTTVNKPNFRYSVSKRTLKPNEKYIAKSLYSMDYFINILKVLNCTTDHFAITIGRDQPATIEDEHFQFLLAPRIEAE